MQVCFNDALLPHSTPPTKIDECSLKVRLKNAFMTLKSDNLHEVTALTAQQHVNVFFVGAVVARR